MKTRSAVTAAFAACLVLLSAGCGDNSSSSASKPNLELKSSGTIAKTTTTEDSSSSGSSSSDSSSSDSSSSSGSSTDSGSSSDSSGSTDTLDPNAVAGLLGDDCAKAYSTYISLAAAAFGSPEDAAKAQNELDQIKGKVPAKIQKDIQVLADGFSAIKTDGIVAAGQKMDSPEFKAASDDLTAYFTNGCKG